MHSSAMRRTCVWALFRGRGEHCTTASLVNVPPLKEGVYLILEVPYTLSYLSSKWMGSKVKYQRLKLNVKTINNFNHGPLLSSVGQ